MVDKNKIALLWLIRESKEGVSVYELREQLESGKLKLPVELDMYTLMSYFNRNVEYYVEEFINLGLIKTKNGKPYHIQSKLIVARGLERVQDIFGISLTASLQRNEASQIVDPHFGRPKPKSPQFAQIFVAMPFAESLKPVYSDHITKVTAALALTCKRADDMFTAHNIMGDVWSAIYHADACIVDCTGRNPNVFYELGIAHTLGRITIPIAQSIDDIPSDLRHLRFIVYQYTPPGMQKFEADLTKTLQSELELDA